MGEQHTPPTDTSNAAATPPESSDYDKALDFLTSLSDDDDGDDDESVDDGTVDDEDDNIDDGAGEAGESKKQEEKKPAAKTAEKKTPEQLEREKRIAERETRRKERERDHELTRITNSANAAQRLNTKLTKENDELRAKLESRSSSRVDELETIDDIVEYLAEKTGKSTDHYWEQFVSRVEKRSKNGGDSEATRELRRLRAELNEEREAIKREREEAKQEQHRASQAEQARQVQQKISEWQDNVVKELEADTERWPSVSHIPAKALRILALEVVEKEYAATGVALPIEEVLDMLEDDSQEEHARSGRTPPKARKVAKPQKGEANGKQRNKTTRTVSNDDAASAQTGIRDMDEHERREYAIRRLSAMAKADDQ